MARSSSFSVDAILLVLDGHPVLRALHLDFDRWTSKPFLEESMFVTAERSVFGSLVLERYGHAFTAGTQGTMEWLGEKARALTHDGAPTFIFGHVMAPHPPFFLDADCTRVVSEQRTGVSFQRDGVDPGVRERFLIDQMVCLHSFLGELSELVLDETVVVVVSDHGTDRRGQLARDAATWTEPDLTERMNVLAAVRGLDDCPLPEALVVPNIMRHVFSCLSGEDLTPVRPRMFPGAGVELDDESVEMLIG